MSREELLMKARDLVDNGAVTLDINTIKIIHQAAHNDLPAFEQFLSNIAEQSRDFKSADVTAKSFSMDLIKVARELNPKKPKSKLKENNLVVKGGKADYMSLNDIADKFKVPVAQLKSQLEMGVKVELEHTKSEKIAKDIAMDHLAEMPDYYTKLKKMEKGETNESKILIKKLLIKALKRNIP